MTFDQHQNGPVYVTQVFTFRVYAALNLYQVAGDNFIRSTTKGLARLNPAHQRTRQALATALRTLRHKIDAKERRRLALHVIHAPQSYGGAIQTQYNQQTDNAIRLLAQG